MDDETKARDLAIKRLKEKRDFRTHLVSYLVVNGFLWVLWAITDSSKSGVPWPTWVTLGWGIGLAINAWTVYGDRSITEADIQREMDRTRGQVDLDDEGR
jgi:hypothetical protein